MFNSKEIKKQKILEAAYQLFSENGYKNTKIADIAVAAGIGKGTVYEYFESKESLLLSIVSNGMETYLSDYENIVESNATQSEKLLNLIEIEEKCAEEHGTRIMKMSQMLLDTSDGLSIDFIKKMNEVGNKKYAYIYKILDKGIKSGEFKNMNTDMVTITITGAIGCYLNIKYGASLLPEIKLPFNIESFEIRELAEFLLKGIRM